MTRELDTTRKSIVSGEVKEIEHLLRFTEAEGLLIPDFQKKFAGKGVYVENSISTLKKAIEKKLFSKFYKKNLNENMELITQVEKIMKKKGLDSINISRKAGILITGFEKVREVIIHDKAAFLLEAKDAGDDGHNKIISLAKEIEIFSLYTIEELDRALDKTNTVHIAFKKSPMAKTVHKDFMKLKNFLEN
ncbi:MAG: DUF448 domain-containing protein [Alphaproteobacteria bacterium]|nr:DUF448 domain-containing protein [Alphaproteobacteria bacterium]